MALASFADREPDEQNDHYHYLTSPSTFPEVRQPAEEYMESLRVRIGNEVEFDCPEYLSYPIRHPSGLVLYPAKKSICRASTGIRAVMPFQTHDYTIMGTSVTVWQY